MIFMDNPKMMAQYLDCLSVLEDNTALLYRKLSERADTPIVASLFLSISQDSSKHSSLLKGVARSISNPKQNKRDCARKLKDVWRMVDFCLEELNKEEKAGKISFLELLPKLDALESQLGEEYYIFVQMKTFQFLAKEINVLYKVKLEKVRNIFESIARDEEHHKEVLATIREVIVESASENDTTPRVKYQNPDSWDQSLPAATYS